MKTKSLHWRMMDFCGPKTREKLKTGGKKNAKNRGHSK